MDPRTHEHAETLVDWSARVERGDDVVVAIAEGAHELGVAVAAALGERGANVVTTYDSAEINRAYLNAHDGDFAAAAHELALYEAADVVLRLGGGHNSAETADVPAATRAARDAATQDVREARLATDWVSTVHPTRSLAQQAGMSYAAYREFVYDAVLRDWAALVEEMAELKTRLDVGSEVRIVNEGTDLRLDVANRMAVNSCASVAYGSHNLPSGEVFTAPAAAEGHVTFDIPMTIRGEPVRDVRLEFKTGEVTDVVAAQGESVIREVVETDAGSRRLGEFGVGMNRGIDRITDNILFDEKMGGTVHLALGRAYDANLPDGETPNDSTVHVDLITDMRGDSRLTIDGDLVQEDGAFVWE
jgi:aminopeptidase